MAPNMRNEVEADSLLMGAAEELTSQSGPEGQRRSNAAGILVSAVLLIAGVAVVTDGSGIRSAGTVQTDGIVVANVVQKGKGEKKPLRGHHHGHHGNNTHHEVAPQCSWPLQNCTDSGCCMKPGQQCFVQNNKTNYATCMNVCTPGPHPEHWDGEWWTCATLGNRAKGQSHCSKMGEDCSQTLCCEQANTQCFEKTKGWATCKSSCDAGAPDLTDVDSNFWSCKKLGPWTQGAAPWVAGQCTPEGQDCRLTQCCAEPGMQCYEQNGDWSSCRYDCQPGQNPEKEWEPEWSCKEIGMRTPSTGPPPAGTVAKWVPEKCSWSGEGCLDTRCCIGMNQQCYQKNKHWAVCKEECKAGRDPYDNETWSCQPLGARSIGLAVKGNPSFFCWSLFQTTTYEMDIMKNQMGQGSGIFQCDEWALLSTDEPTVLGKTLEGHEAKTMQVEWAEITQSVDGTAGNAKLFINCWNVIVQDGRWNNHAWTLKVDPDAVLLPSRLRDHLRDHVLENVYVVNCNKFPSSPNFPMMYGSLEIYSWKAIQSYANGMSQCMSGMGAMIPLWGEDYFMTHCLDSIGVGRINDFASVGDNVCLGANCGDAWVAAFHPFKSVDEWQKCWDIAHR